MLLALPLLMLLALPLLMLLAWPLLMLLALPLLMLLAWPLLMLLLPLLLLLQLMKKLHCWESKPKFLSPNSFSTIAEITLTTSLIVEIPETYWDDECLKASKDLKEPSLSKAIIFCHWKLYAVLTIITFIE
ncbi:unnamed protein product, partial [Boreogadus saida]